MPEDRQGGSRPRRTTWQVIKQSHFCSSNSLHQSKIFAICCISWQCLWAKSVALPLTPHWTTVTTSTSKSTPIPCHRLSAHQKDRERERGVRSWHHVIRLTDNATTQTVLYLIYSYRCLNNVMLLSYCICNSRDLIDQVLITKLTQNEAGVVDSCRINIYFFF